MRKIKRWLDHPLSNFQVSLQTQLQFPQPGLRQLLGHAAKKLKCQGFLRKLIAWMEHQIIWRKLSSRPGGLGWKRMLRFSNTLIFWLRTSDDCRSYHLAEQFLQIRNLGHGDSGGSQSSCGLCRFWKGGNTSIPSSRQKKREMPAGFWKARLPLCLIYRVKRRCWSCSLTFEHSWKWKGPLLLWDTRTRQMLLLNLER